MFQGDSSGKNLNYSIHNPRIQTHPQRPDSHHKVRKSKVELFLSIRADQAAAVPRKKGHNFLQKYGRPFSVGFRATVSSRSVLHQFTVSSYHCMWKLFLRGVRGQEKYDFLRIVFEGGR